MESYILTKQDFYKVYPDEKRGLLYCYTGGTKVVVIGVESGSIVGSFSVSSNARRFFFNEDKEFFIVASCSSEIVVYRANEYDAPYWKFKLKRTDNADHDFVVRDNILYGFANKGSGLRYFIIDLNTREIKDEFFAHSAIDGGYSSRRYASGCKFGEISGEVERVYDGLHAELEERASRDAQLVSDVPQEYYRVFYCRYFYKSADKCILITEKGVLIVPNGAELPKAFAAAVELRRTLMAHTVLDSDYMFYPDEKNDCIYAYKRWWAQGEDNRYTFYKLDAKSGKVVGQIKLHGNIGKIEKSGDFLVVGNGKNLTVFKDGNFNEPCFDFLLEECYDDPYKIGSYDWWGCLNDKIYTSSRGAFEFERKIEESYYAKFASIDEYCSYDHRAFYERDKNGDYERVDYPFSSQYYEIDLIAGEKNITTVESIFRAHVIEGRIYMREHICNPPASWLAAVKQAEENAKIKREIKVPKKYKDLGGGDYFANDKFEFISYPNGIAVLPKTNTKTEAEEDGEEVVYTEKYVTEHGITKDLLEKCDDGEVLYLGYFWALESIERKAKEAGIPTYDFVCDPAVTDEENILYSVGWLNTEVDEGGVEQYFSNGSEEEFEALLNALQTVGATQTYKTVSKCVKLRKKYDALENPTESASEKLCEKISDEWDNLTEDYVCLAITYIRNLHK
ncbi:MAG: DMP19 family protein [Clostridia bacterium]|nr:DMP19 family protein [Clostridia bacterium]